MREERESETSETPKTATPLKNLHADPQCQSCGGSGECLTCEGTRLLFHGNKAVECVACLNTGHCSCVTIPNPLFD